MMGGGKRLGGPKTQLKADAPFNQKLGNLCPIKGVSKDCIDCPEIGWGYCVHWKANSKNSKKSSKSSFRNTLEVT